MRVNENALAPPGHPAYQMCWCVRFDGEIDESGCPVFVWIRQELHSSGWAVLSLLTGHEPEQQVDHQPEPGNHAGGYETEPGKHDAQGHALASIKPLQEDIEVAVSAAASSAVAFSAPASTSADSKYFAFTCIVTAPSTRAVHHRLPTTNIVLIVARLRGARQAHCS